jgi:hypothetical protein
MLNTLQKLTILRRVGYLPPDRSSRPQGAPDEAAPPGNHGACHTVRRQHGLVAIPPPAALAVEDAQIEALWHRYAVARAVQSLENITPSCSTRH